MTQRYDPATVTAEWLALTGHALRFHHEVGIGRELCACGAIWPCPRRRQLLATQRAMLEAKAVA